MKQCKDPQCTLGVFGGDYCKRHQYKRSDLKRLQPRSTKIKTNHKPSGVIGSKRLIQQSFGFVTQKEMFEWVWANREHKCQFTGEDLNKVPKWKWHWCFLHVLPKGQYPLWKLNPHNIVLGWPEFHAAADNFTEDERTKHPTWDFGGWFELQDKLKQEYKQFLIDVL